MSDISARLDRLPITSLHRIAVAALAFAYFFELGDLSTFAFSAPGIMKAWHIPVSAVALITSASFGGMFIGAVSGGWFADRFGRKRGFIISILIYTLFSLLNALSWNVATLAIFRFLTGVGLSGMTVIANTYVSEFFPARVRGKYMGRIVTIGLIGIPATAWVARFVVPMAPWGWRLVFVWGALGIFALIMAARMKESPRWYLRHDDPARANAIVAELEAAAVVEYGTLPPVRPVAAEPAPAAGTLALLFEGKQIGRTIILLLVWIFQTLGFYGFVAWVPTLLVQHGFSLVQSLSYTSLIAICNPIGSLIASDLVERFERKWFITIDGILIAIFGVGYGLSFSPVFIVLFGALVVMTIQGMAVALYTYTPELYPTEVRSSGMGLTYGVGRLANVAGPFFVSTIFAAAGYLSVFVYIAACWLVVALVVGLFGPTTTGKPLEVLE
ncbi:MAG TPA: MFS transporter [Acetobacteraceae bacterium]|nr:MFS transporter [Acetobacteraceae bacterium]